MPSTPSPRRLAELFLAALYLVTGVTASAVAVWLLHAAYSLDGGFGGQRGAEFQWMGQAYAGPVGVLCLVAAVALVRRWPGRWAILAAPLLYIAAAFAFAF